jgi:hypothetical protein
MLAKRKTCPGELLESDPMELLQAGGLRAGRTEVAGIGQRRAPPQIERRSEMRYRALRIAVSVGLASDQDLAFEPFCIELIGLKAQEISVRTRRETNAGRVWSSVRLQDTP